MKICTVLILLSCLALLSGAPILIWTHTERTAQFNPGYLLPDDQIVLLAKYMVARWGAHQVVWMLAGDAETELRGAHRQATG